MSVSLPIRDLIPLSVYSVGGKEGEMTNEKLLSSQSSITSSSSSTVRFCDTFRSANSSLRLCREGFH